MNIVQTIKKSKWSFPIVAICVFISLVLWFTRFTPSTAKAGDLIRDWNVIFAIVFMAIAVSILLIGFLVKDKGVKMIIFFALCAGLSSCSTGWTPNPVSHQDSINQGLIIDTVKVDTTLIDHSQIQ